MSTLISDYFGVDFDLCGVFGCSDRYDSHYFINVTRLKDNHLQSLLNHTSKK